MKKILQLLKGKLAQNVGWLVGSKIYQVVLNLVIFMLMARYLGPANFGLINYASSFALLFTALCTLGIYDILVNELLEHRQDGKILGSAICMRLCSSALSVGVLVLLTWLLNPGEPLTVQVVLLYSISLIFQSFDSLHGWYQANLRSKVTAAINAAGYTISAIYKAYLLITFKDVRWFAAAHAVEYAFVAVLLLISYSHDNGKIQPLRFDFKVAKRVLARSYHFILSGMMVALYGQMDRVMLKAMISETAVGFYSAAATINNCWVFVLVAIIDASNPVIVKHHPDNKEAFEAGLVRLYGIILYLASFVAICMTLLSRPLIRILFGADYLQGSTALCILCWGTPFAYLGVARSIWLVTQKKQKYIKYISATGALCNLVLNAFLIPVWGINGAAFATLVTRIVTNFVIDFLIPDTRGSAKLFLKALVFWKYLKPTASPKEESA